MSGKQAEWVYDELLCFLGSAFFQVPVCGFIEEKCLIFDPSVEDSDEYKKIHREYKKIIEALLDAFMKDTKLSYDDVIKALNDMNSKKDIREIFQGLFEQVLAMDDLEIFVRLMTQKNIELQQQALMLILKTTGQLPESLKEGGEAEPQSAGGMMDDDEILRRVLEQSKREYEEEQKKQKKQEKKDAKEVEKMVAVSKQEVTHLEQQKQVERLKMNEIQKRREKEEIAAMASMSLKDMPPLAPAAQNKAQTSQVPVTKDRPPAPAPAPMKPMPAKQEQPKITTPGMSSPAAGGASLSPTSLGPGLQGAPKLPGISSSQAAAQWLQEAQAESSQTQSHDDAVKKAAAAMAGMSADEIKKRQAYLIQQRDKLIAMKKAEREKQLLSAEKSQPTRPMSSRAARQTLQADGDKGDNKVSPEEQKKIEMRRTIANKLKAELMGGN